MRMRRMLIVLLGLLAATAVSAEQRLTVVRVDRAPDVDGRSDDAAWSLATAITTRDTVANIDVTLKAVYTADEIVLLVQFPDDAEDRDHKTLHWDAAQERYRNGPEREDTFVLKWSMEPQPVDLSLASDRPYRADVWYWKSHRTDHSGHADDKLQIYSALSSPRAKRLRSKSGLRFYLTRRGDRGAAAYESIPYDRRDNDAMPKYRLSAPEGSRGDIKAKGEWKDGIWTVEFRRRLDTGNDDDVRFDPSLSYHFGASRFEIAGRKPDPTCHQPNFGSGEIGERLVLVFN